MIVIEDLTISLLTLIGIRFIAFLIFLELFIRNRGNKYAVLVMAWLVYMLAPIWGLLGYFTTGNTDHPMFGYFASIGTLLLIVSVFLYYKAISKEKLIVGIPLIVFITGIAVWSFPSVSIYLTFLSQFFFIFVTLIAVVFHRKWFITIGGTSYYWLFPILLLSSFHAFGFYFIYPDAPLSVKFYLTFVINCALLVFFIHFDHNQTLMQLRESEERYRVVVEDSPGWICRFLPDGKITFVNRTYSRYFGKKTDEIIGSNFFSAIPKSYQQAVINDIRSLNSNFPIMTNEYRVMSPTGRIRWQRWTNRGTFDKKGKVIAYQSFGEDVTEQILAEQELKILNIELDERVHQRTEDLRKAQEKLIQQERHAVLGKLAASVGHELRNPLGVISNSIYYLKLILPKGKKSVQEHLAIVSTEILNSDRIITDLIDFTHVSLPEPDKIQLSELILEVLEQHSAPSGIDVNTHLAAGVPPVYIDPEQIKQVLLNLITNAYQAMPEGGKLLIETRKERDFVCLAITDTGEGILEEYMGKLFEPLFSTRARGIGLGLAISKNLLDANNCHISVESSGIPGQGSTFHLSIPVWKEYKEHH